MKKLILILVLLPQLILAQYPITEEFDPGTSWTFTNGAGIQNYGGAENYGTFNLGSTPYPNSSTIDITSPVGDYTDCVSTMDVSFHLSGIIESGWDFMTFQYFDAGAWVDVQSFTGFQNSVFSYTIPSTATQFNFQLVTDGSVNTYFTFPPPATNVYYYDIQYFEIDCAAQLPVELLDFSGDCDRLLWSTASELNNDYFVIEKSRDLVNWSLEGKIDGVGTTTEPQSYYYNLNQSGGLMYYRLKQVDFDGQSEIFKYISIDCSSEEKVLVGVYNMLGQEVSNTSAPGIYIYLYSDGSTVKSFK